MSETKAPLPNPITETHQLAAGFLARFRGRAPGHQLDGRMELLAEDPAGFAAAITVAPADLAQALEQDRLRAPVGPANVRQDVIASAACDADGHLVVMDEVFRAWVLPHKDLQAGLAQFDPVRPSISFLVEDRGRFIAVAAASLSHARGWPLAPAVRASLEAGKASVAVLARIDSLGDPADGAGSARTALGLTRHEERVCNGLVRTGTAQGAARQAGVSYETARDAIKAAKKKAGAHTQAELVSVLLNLTTGELAEPNLDGVLRDLFGLSDRQVRVALAAASGAARDGIARIARCSPHTVKADMKVLFDAFSVGSVAALSRAVAQVRVLSALAGASSIEVLGPQQAREPLRLLPRANRTGRIAFADHGPVGALPCLILHTATTGRHLPPAHVAALQANGLRPISLDRPGTGLSDPVDGDLLAGSAEDMVDILDALGIERTSVIARGGAMVLGAFAARHGDRLHRGVAINPEPRPHEDDRRHGFAGNIKRLVFEHPALIETLAGYLARRSASDAVAHLVRHVLAGSPADLATLEQPGMMAAYVRATQQSALQNGAGFIAISRTEPVAPDMPLSDGRAIAILIGAEDPLYRHEDGLARWQSAWPGCRVTQVPNAGRLLQFQRPDLVAAAARG